MNKQNSKTKLFGCNSHPISHIFKLTTHNSSLTSYNSKGITLVALVVTIIVLLILAGVTITSLLGDEGIISKAQNAAKATKKSQIIESVRMDILIAQLEGNLTQEKLEEILGNYGEVQKDEEGNITGLKPDGLDEIIPIEDLLSGVVSENPPGEPEIPDTTAPTVTINLSATSTTPNTAIEASVSFADNETGVATANCKYIFDTTSGNIGTTNTLWETANSFENNPQTITLTAEAEGTYYLHVLTVDNAGNKGEKISEAIVVEEGTPKIENNLGDTISTTENTDLKDSFGNKITVPAGFYIVTPSQDSTVTYDYSEDGTPVVQDGIVIQNKTDGNQFVWVPIGDIKNKDGSTTTIKLGRYSNFTMSGTTPPAPAQEATTSSYNTAVLIERYYFEVSNSFAGDSSKGLSSANGYDNTKATNLQDWICTSLANGGYYIARYEAGEHPSDLTKAASLKGTDPWPKVTQPNAAKAAKATYPVTGTNSSNYYSDLINSYAWDTAIVFIQAYEDKTYASANYCTHLTTTGSNPDKVCNIHDMSGNVQEWSTETSSDSLGSVEMTCTQRGGYYALDVGRGAHEPSYREGFGANRIQQSQLWFQTHALCKVTLYPGSSTTVKEHSERVKLRACQANCAKIILI